MTEDKKLRDLLEESQDDLFQRIIDRQEGRVGLAEAKKEPDPTQSELDRWNRELDALERGTDKDKAHRMVAWRRLGIAAVIAVLLMIVTVAALQIRILNVVETIQEKFTHLSPDKSAEDVLAGWENVWLPTSMPEDFMLTDVVENGDIRAVEYTDSEGTQLTFYQYNSDTMLHLDTENAVVSNCHVGEFQCRLVYKAGWSALYWNNSDLAFAIEYDPDKTPDPVIQQVAQSVALDNK